MQATIVIILIPTGRRFRVRRSSDWFCHAVFRYAGALREAFPVMSMTDLEIDDAIRQAWRILYAEPTASPLERRLAAALLAVTGGTQAYPHWVTPDDLWRDRLAVLAEQGVWLAAWGPRPGEPNCQVPPALLPESQTRRENVWLLWRSTVQDSTDADGGSATRHKLRSRRRNEAEQAIPARPRTRRRRSPVPEPDSV
jgi:hypothetical protein